MRVRLEVNLKKQKKNFFFKKEPTTRTHALAIIYKRPAINELDNNKKKTEISGILFYYYNTSCFCFFLIYFRKFV
jgi:hypothetical protein